MKTIARWTARAVLFALLAPAGASFAQEAERPARSGTAVKVVWADRTEIAIRLTKAARSESVDIDEFDKVNAAARINQHLAFLRTEAARMLSDGLRRSGTVVLPDDAVPATSTLTLSYQPEIEAHCMAPTCQSIVNLTLEYSDGQRPQPVWRRTIRVASPEAWNVREDRPLTESEEQAALASLQQDFVEKVVSALARDRLL